MYDQAQLILAEDRQAICKLQRPLHQMHWPHSSQHYAQHNSMMSQPLHTSWRFQHSYWIAPTWITSKTGNYRVSLLRVWEPSGMQQVSSNFSLTSGKQRAVMVRVCHLPFLQRKIYEKVGDREFRNRAKDKKASPSSGWQKLKHHFCAPIG